MALPPFLQQAIANKAGGNNSGPSKNAIQRRLAGKNKNKKKKISKNTPPMTQDTDSDGQ